MLDWFFENESKQAERIYRMGFINNEFSAYECNLLIKYALLELDYGEARTKTFIKEFCEKHDPYFNYILLRKKIKAWIRTNTGRQWNQKHNAVLIRESELQQIRKIHDFKIQRILLVFLVFAKRQAGYVYENQFSSMRKILKIKDSEKEIRRKMHKAYQAGLLRDSGENYFFKFLDDSSSQIRIKIDTVDVLFKIDSLYKEYCGGILEYCKQCGNEFLKNSSTHMYCNTCSANRRKEKVRKNVNRHRGIQVPVI